MNKEAYCIKVQGDKSISHRALILSAISGGEVVVKDCSKAKDVENTRKILGQLGVECPRDGNEIKIRGVGLHGLAAPDRELDTGNSGTGIRLLSGLLAGQHFDATLTGDEQIQRRPMGRVVEPLRLMGAKIEGGANGDRAPLKISGLVEGERLKGINYRMPVKSAQVKSALLLAGLYADGQVAIQERAITRDHTERMLKHFGCPVEREGMTVRLTQVAELNAELVQVPGDFSAAAFLMVSAIHHPKCRLEIINVGLNPTRLGFLDILKRMGANVEEDIKEEVNGEPWGSIKVSSSGLRGIELTPVETDRAIDELPLVALAASRASGKTRISGAEELRHKESDRIKSSVELVCSLGGKAEETADGLIIEGVDALQAGTVTTYGDHRIAMAALSAGYFSGTEIEVTDADCISTSDPTFPELLSELKEKMPYAKG